MCGSDRIRWRCPNRNCNTWFVGTTDNGEQTAPRCICGRTMQKEETEAFGYLDFLKEGTAEAEVAAEKE